MLHNITFSLTHISATHYINKKEHYRSEFTLSILHFGELVHDSSATYSLLALSLSR